MTKTKPPTLAQMLHRSTDGHRAALERVAAGQPLARIGATVGEIRGLRTILATLYRWDVVASADKPKVGAGGSTTFPLVLTARGRELLAAILDRDINRLTAAQAGDVAGWPSHTARATRIAELTARRDALEPDPTITVTDPTLDETGRFPA